MGFGFDRPWFPWLVLSVLLAILVAGGAYWRLGSRLGLRERIRLASLRALALVLLLGAWFAPSRIRAISEPIRAQVPILADRSMSMSIDDESEGQTRWELARQAAERLAQRLDERFDVRLYAFDRTLHLFSEEQEPIGRSTAILDTVRSAMEMAAGSPLAGVILLTDGIQTVGASEIPQDWPAPIFAVGLGSPMPPKDVALLHVEAEPVYYLGEVAEARVRVRAAGYPGRSFVVTLTQEGQPLTTARFSPESAESVQELQLQWRPEREGAFQYELAIAPLPDEFSPRNNRLSFTAQVLPGRIRVLLVDAGPRLDFALLRRTLQRLPMVEPTAVLLTPPEAPQTEEALPIRLGVYPLDGESPRLPAGPEEWNRYDVVIVGDVPPMLWRPADREALRNLLSRPGKGIVWLAGERWLSRPLQAEALQGMLPVHIVGGRAAVAAEPFAPIPSAEGRVHPVTQLAEEVESSVEVWQRLPLWERRFVGVRPNPTATVLLEDARSGDPVLVFQRVDAGKVVYIGTDALWVWALGAKTTGDGAVVESFERFWSQLLRWMVTPADAKQVVLRLDRSRVEVGDTLSVQVRAYDAGFRPAAGALVELTVTDPRGEAAPIPVQEVEPGRYQARVPVRLVGNHRLEASAQSGGVLLGRDALSFEAQEPRLEFERIARDDRFLQALAQASGGKVIPKESLDSVVQELRESQETRTVRVRDALWDHPLLFLAVLGLLGTEWFLRKRKGLL